MQSERIAQLARRAQQGDAGRVRLGFAGASVNAVVSALVRHVHAERPGVELLLLRAQLSQPGLQRLRTGDLDAIVGRWDFLPRDVRSRVVATEELLVALPTGHRLSRQGTIDAADLAEEPWIVLPGGEKATLSNRLQLLGRRGRFVPRIVDTATDSATQLLLVEAGMGIALTFSGVQQNHPVQAIEFRPVRPDLGTVAVRLAWGAADTNPALAAWIAALGPE